MLAWVVIYRRHLRHSTPIFYLCVLSVSALSSLTLSLNHSPLSSIFRIFFQVPYPATPLFATLAKTAGVCTNNSHSGTHQSRVQFDPYPPFPSTQSPFLSYSCALFCAFLHSPKLQLFSFQVLPHSLLKIRGVGYPSSSFHRAKRRRIRGRMILWPSD